MDSQFVAMLFCHLARADSLREICQGFSCCRSKLSHFGVVVFRINLTKIL
ncbi:hypothetical protein DFAR_620007 [Desulfarculales bacterium]